MSEVAGPGHWPASDGEGRSVPDGVDPAVPSPARMYDYYLSGATNYAADREAAERALSVVPSGRLIAREERRVAPEERCVARSRRSVRDTQMCIETGGR